MDGGSEDGDDDGGAASPASPGHEDLSTHAPARLARECKSSRNGTRLSCVACRAADREALTYLLTYKNSTSRKKASYQITCDYHEPDVVVKPGGRTYRLACRRTRKVEKETLEAEREAVQFLVRWVRRGPCFPGSRKEHQDMESDFENESTSSDDDGRFDSEDEDEASCSAFAPAATVSTDASCWVCGEKHDKERCPIYPVGLGG